MIAADPGRLHVITDETVQDRFTHVELGALAAEGGADVVQLREKRERDAAERLRVARALCERLGDGRARLVINDHADIAAACGADGVHLGPQDLEPAAARRLLGARALIGLTANDRRTARRWVNAPADYLGVGPVFGTAAKRDPAPALGLAGLRAIVALAGRPVIAIGNITPDRVEEVLAAGAWGVAVLSDVARAVDPAERTATFAAAIRRALAGGAV
jgi:thiamine-phosphate diphosphorylase